MRSFEEEALKNPKVSVNADDVKIYLASEMHLDWCNNVVALANNVMELSIFLAKDHVSALDQDELILACPPTSNDEEETKVDDLSENLDFVGVAKYLLDNHAWDQLGGTFKVAFFLISETLEAQRVGTTEELREKFADEDFLREQYIIQLLRRH